MNRVRVSTLVLACTLVSWPASTHAVTILFTEKVSSVQGVERPVDVAVSVDVAACPTPETSATAAPCVRRTLRNPEFGFVELSVPPGTFSDARESNPARALLLEPDEKTISDQVTLFVEPAEPTGRPRDTINIRFESDPIEGLLGVTPDGLRFSAVESGGEVDVSSKFFTGTGTKLTDQYTLPQGFSIKATSDLDAGVPEPATLVLVALGLAGIAMALRTRRMSPTVDPGESAHTRV